MPRRLQGAESAATNSLRVMLESRREADRPADDGDDVGLEQGLRQ